MMRWWLLFLAFSFAIVEWASEVKRFRWGILLSKPLVMILILAWVLTLHDLNYLLADPSTFRIVWFIAGLSFCLVGDLFLMGPERFFLPGLISFLIGHIFYIKGFGLIVPFVNGRGYLVFLIIPLLILGVWVYRHLARGMDASKQGRMKNPIAFYAIVISIMLYTAMSTLFLSSWRFEHALFVAVGALLFYLSDILNAIARFVDSFPHYRLWVMTTYHLAQMGIAVGVTLHYYKMAVLS
jgi:uncharacterized membrane protein YhhN